MENDVGHFIDKMPTIEPVTADEHARAMVPITFRNLTENLEEENRSKLFTGRIDEMCKAMKSFLVMVFGDKVLQKTEVTFEMVTTNSPEDLLARANDLEGTNVSLAEVSVFRGAFVVMLTQDLKNHAKWQAWLDTPENPHITLAYIGSVNMKNLSTLQQNLIIEALRCLAVLGLSSPEKLKSLADFVRPLVKETLVLSSQIENVDRDLKNILQDGSRSDRPERTGPARIGLKTCIFLGRAAFYLV